jgi:hypothetical protein
MKTSLSLKNHLIADLPVQMDMQDECAIVSVRGFWLLSGFHFGRETQARVCIYASKA